MAATFISPLLFLHQRGFAESTTHSELDADLDDLDAWPMPASPQLLQWLAYCLSRQTKLKPNNITSIMLEQNCITQPSVINIDNIQIYTIQENYHLSKSCTFLKYLPPYTFPGYAE